jgi:hypothetical protein
MNRRLKKLITLSGWLASSGLKEEARQVFKYSMPRNEGPLWEQPSYGAESYDEFYPDLEDELVSREKEEDNLYHGRNVIWIGTTGKMVRADSHYVYPIQGNIFYDEKISQLTDKINSSSEKVILYAPYGRMSKVEVSEIEESIKYQEDYGHAPLTTGDEELDQYLADKEEWLSDNSDYDDDYNIVKESYDELKKDMELQLKEAERNRSGDFGEFIFQIRDGNHRAFAAINAGEKYIWLKISDNQVQDIESGRDWLKGYGDILE